VKENKKEPHGYLCLYPNAKHSINISNYIVCATALLRVLVSLGWPWFNQDKITYGHLLCSFSSSFLASHSFRLVLSCLNYPLHALFCLFPWKLQETKKQAYSQLGCCFTYTACSSMKTKLLDSVQLLPLFRELVSFLSGKSMMNLEGFCLILYFFS
jgi:hypothetical protein